MRLDVSKVSASVESESLEALRTMQSSEVAALELVVLDDKAPCQPGAQEQCEYKVVNNGFSLQGRQHEKVGAGYFADGMVVTRAEDADAQHAKTYVWKRFNMHKAAAVKVHETVKAVLSFVKNLNCPHTAVPLDMNPKVAIDRTFSTKSWKSNGFIFEKMDGDAEDWWEKHTKGVNRYKGKRCAPRFMQEMLDALACLRRAGLVHTDVKLDNILFKESPKDRLGLSDCPSWYLSDFDLLTPAGEGAPYRTPPLKMLQTIWTGSTGADLSQLWGKQNEKGEYATLLSGAEDFNCLAVAYRNSVDNTVGDDELCNFVIFAQRQQSRTKADVVGPSAFPPLGFFNKGSSSQGEVTSQLTPEALKCYDNAVMVG